MILRDSMSIFCVLLNLIASSAFAQDADGTDDALSAMREIQEKTRLLGCENEGLIAANIMLARQFGHTKKQIKLATVPVGSLDSDLVVKAAFETPRRASRAAQIRESDRFKARYTVACLNR